VLLSLADKIVHVILPLADEYQTTKTLEKANQFLAKKSKIIGDKISSAQVIQNILQAELYRLDDYLDESIAIASRKCFEKLVEHLKFNEITQETRLKIMTKRWKDMDEVFKIAGHMRLGTGCVNFYDELNTPVMQDTAPEESMPSAFSLDTNSTNSNTSRRMVKSTSIVTFLENSLKPFIQNN
jgi:hypothetical protein